MDVKDIMGLSRTTSAAAERAEKPKEKKPVKPKGMSRYNWQHRRTAPLREDQEAEQLMNDKVVLQPFCQLYSYPFLPRREAFALLSGLHPLQPSQLTGDLRKQSTVKSLRDKAKRSNRGTDIAESVCLVSDELRKHLMISLRSALVVEIQVCISLMKKACLASIMQAE